MHSKYDNMYKNIMVHALIYMNNDITTSINCMLSLVEDLESTFEDNLDIVFDLPHLQKSNSQ